MKFHNAMWDYNGFTREDDHCRSCPGPAYYPVGWDNVRKKMFKYQINVCFYSQTPSDGKPEMGPCGMPQPDYWSTGYWNTPSGLPGLVTARKILAGHSGMAPSEMSWEPGSGYDGVVGMGYDYTKEKRVACAKEI